MKLALVSPYDFAYPGGVTEHVAHLAEQFRARDHEVHIIAPSSDDETEPTATGEALVHRIGRVVSIPANGSVARITLSLRSYLQAKRLLQEQQFDLIHLHEPMMPALPLTVLRHSNSTNIGTFHAFRNTPLTYFYGKPILRPFFRKLHGHIAVSSAARDFVGEYFPADYRIIPNGIDFPRFFERRPDARLVVVGRGRPLEGYRRFAARQGWSPSDVVFAGYVPSEDLPRYYQSCDVFCAPNTGQESFGIVLLEAMAAGAPIVASAIPGYRDVVSNEREGLLVEPKNPAALADAVARLLSNPELRASMRRVGHAKARGYDWPVVADQVLDYYADVLDRYAEAGVFLGLVWWYQSTANSLGLTLAYLAVIGSLMVSYARARAEGVGLQAAEGGWFQRPERLIALGVGLVVAPFVPIALEVVLAIL